MGFISTLPRTSVIATELPPAFEGEDEPRSAARPTPISKNLDCIDCAFPRIDSSKGSGYRMVSRRIGIVQSHLTPVSERWVDDRRREGGDRRFRSQWNAIACTRGTGFTMRRKGESHAFRMRTTRLHPNRA